MWNIGRHNKTGKLKANLPESEACQFIDEDCAEHVMYYFRAKFHSHFFKNVFPPTPAP